MELSKQNILYICRATQHGGTENVVLQLCEIFSPLVNSIVVASADGFAVQELKKYNIRHYEIPDLEKKTPQSIIRTCSILATIIQKENITTIHTHHRMAAFYVRLLGLDKKCYFINTSHNTFFNKRVLTRFSYKNCNLIACGEMVKQNLCDVYGLKNVTVIHNAVKPFDEEIKVEKEFYEAKNEGYFLVGNVGRLTEQKGMIYYIDAMPMILSRHPNVKFYIIGDGEKMEELIERCQNIHVKPTFMGFRKDIRGLMSQLDLVVLSSLWEGLPLTAIEAFSVGKTMVATSVDGTVEVVEDYKNGLLVNAKDPEMIADKVCWIIEHPDERRQMEINAKRTFEMEFSFNILANTYIEYYRGL